MIPLCLWFAAELTVGIVMVHAHAGWFVVGGGSGGMEFSVLLIARCVDRAHAPRRRALRDSPESDQKDGTISRF